MHLPKKGLRALGIAESYSGRTFSTLAGVVMRKDLRIDGFCFGTVTVGGMDATESITGMVQSLERRDLNVILLSGCVISWFNVIDPGRIAEVSGVPVICVTYEESDGLENEIRHHFPHDEKRLLAYRNLGKRIPVPLHTGQTIFIRAWEISLEDAGRLCNDFTHEGGIPEPLRVARLCARSRSSLTYQKPIGEQDILP
ncbi:DUF99 family protein [Methanoregula sp.]|uniref:endonuclease dU n=1 Tax=Methanoregula sp. TaxID=2052170 RepID=UPI002601C02F|nr:DUF99 family protein [Methanoregula sp.]MDD5143958.1 DUF99 family protein [Methanoregula sp.]